jgi:hypothetical protein
MQAMGEWPTARETGVGRRPRRFIFRPAIVAAAPRNRLETK